MTGHITKPIAIFIGLLAIFAGCLLWYWLAPTPAQVDTKATTTIDDPIAQVETIRLQRGEIDETLTAYGVVLPLPDKLKTLSVPYTALVATIQVNQGQVVSKGDPLLTLRPGADAVLQLQQAQTEREAALRENHLLRERIRLKLATKQDLVASTLRVKQAGVMLKNLAERGIAEQQTITAEQAGIIYLVNVQQGQIVTAGTPLLQLVDQNQWVVRLGIEPEDYPHLKTNQPVSITPVNTPIAEPVKGLIEIITQQIDPGTRLLNVFVRPERNQTLLLNDFVEGKIILSSTHAWLLPPQAVLPDDGGYSLFTVENGHAVKHRVKLGLENDDRVEVIAADLQEGDEVVVLGNYELEPGMAVSVEPNSGTKP